MIRDEMRELAKSQLLAYRRHNGMIADWEAKIDPEARRASNLGIRGNRASDPTGMVAANRIDPPQYILDAQRWVDAINDAWADLLAEDDADGILGIGKAFVLEEYYGLSAVPVAPYVDKVDHICDACCISRSTLNTWLRSGIEAVILHAVARQLM